jgi:hypothetical protein
MMRTFAPRARCRLHIRRLLPAKLFVNIFFWPQGAEIQEKLNLNKYSITIFYCSG